MTSLIISILAIIIAACSFIFRKQGEVGPQGSIGPKGDKGNDGTDGIDGRDGIEYVPEFKIESNHLFYRIKSEADLPWKDLGEVVGKNGKNAIRYKDSLTAEDIIRLLSEEPSINIQNSELIASDYFVKG